MLSWFVHSPHKHCSLLLVTVRLAGASYILMLAKLHHVSF